MTEQEKGCCKICMKYKAVNRKYYYYDFKCDCHSPQHFEIVNHCDNCEPKAPDFTRVWATPTEVRGRV